MNSLTFQRKLQVWELLSFDVWIDGRKAGEIGARILLDPPLERIRAEVRLWKSIPNSVEKKPIGAVTVGTGMAKLGCIPEIRQIDKK